MFYANFIDGKAVRYDANGGSGEMDKGTRSRQAAIGDVRAPRELCFALGRKAI